MLPSNSGGTNQQIKFTLIVEAQDSIAKAKEVEDRIAAIKKEMQALQQQTNISFKALSQGMQRAADDAAKLKKPLLSQFMTGDPNDPTKQILTPENKQKLLEATNAYKEALKQAIQYKKEISRASQELVKQEVADSKQRVAAEKEVSNAQNILAKEVLLQRSIANQKASQLAIADAREEAKAVRVANLEKGRSDKERAAIAIAATNEAKANYKRAIQEEIAAHRQLAIATQAQISMPGSNANRLVENAKASVEAAKQQVAVTKAISQDAVQHQRAVETANARMATSFLRLGNALKYAFMGGLAFGILSFFQQLPAAIMKATEAAVDFSKTQLALAVGLREMRRRSGEAPMFEDVSAQIQELQGRFKGLYSQMDLTESYSVAISKLGRLGASFEDVNKVVETSAVLAQLNEKSLKDTSAALSTYLNSGVSQGLENTGVIVGRAADKFVAFEKGLQSATLDGIDPAAKAMLRLQFVAKQVDPQLAELADRPMIIANSWDEANNSIKETTVELGSAFAPFVIRFKKGWADILGFLSDHVVPVFQDVFVFILERVGAFAGQTIYFFAMVQEQLKRFANKETLVSIEEFWMGFENAAVLGSKAATKSVKEDFIKSSDDAIAAWANEKVDFMGAIIPDSDEAESKMKEFWAELFKQINDLIVDYGRDVADAWTDYQEELVEIDREYHQKRLDIEEDFQRKLADLARENQQKIEDENRKYQQQKEDVAREYNQKIEDANREYRDREEEAEEEFQKKLRRLREDFLFDLEDAVRERDARQIMSLIKRYNMDRERLIEDFQDEKEERQKNYRDQLEEIRLWRQRRLEELAIEHQRRLEEIQLEYEREREEAARNRDRELEETEIWRQEQEDAAKLAYERELEDLKRHFEDRMTEILTSLMEEKNIQAKYADEIAALIKKTFGPGGKIENSFDNFNKVIDESMAKALEAIAIIQQLEEQLAIPDTGTDTTTPSTTPDAGELPDTETPSDRNLPDNPNSGGSVSSFGAALPSPVGVSDMMNSTPSVSLPTSAATIADASNQSAKIEIYLSDGLEAKITDQTMTELIEVISQVRK